MSDAGKGIAREIQIRDRIEHEVHPVAAQGGQTLPTVEGKLVKAHAGHGLFDQRRLARQREQQLRQRLAVAHSRAAAAIDEIDDELLLQALVLRQRLRRQLGEVDHLDAVVAQRLGEGIVLLLRAAQIGDVVKQQALQRVRNELLQLRTGAVQQDALQRHDLAFDLNGHANPSCRPRSPQSFPISGLFLWKPVYHKKWKNTTHFSNFLCRFPFDS